MHISAVINHFPILQNKILWCH